MRVRRSVINFLARIIKTAIERMIIMILRGSHPRAQTPGPRTSSKEETMRNRIAATLIALALSMSHIAGAQAFTNGWNFIRPSNCLGGPAVGLDFVFVYPITGGTLFTTDAITIACLRRFVPLATVSTCF